ncbi:hypothetical protein [Leptolyngbya sp. PCC 6406]|uniref:hypothetical protein n=1 Tax=Leptolyngbya sp. PCC 6406 TaxID=1173264 RepID=UPI0002ABA412|nr:hypothetical protein [Leptolyngbya sp. PCC 6406]
MGIDGGAVLQRRCDRNRKRSKRRAIFCPEHGCLVHSVSQKYPLYAEFAEQLQDRGMGRRASLLVVATHGAVLLEGEWLEAFWCDDCNETRWYHVRRVGDRAYEAELAPVYLWEQATKVIHPRGNPSVSDFTRRQARMTNFNGVKDFRFM